MISSNALFLIIALVCCVFDICFCQLEALSLVFSSETKGTLAVIVPQINYHSFTQA